MGPCLRILVGHCPLGDLCHLSGTDAPGARPDPLDGSIYQRTHPLNIGVEAALRLIIRVADIVANRRLLSAEITNLGHWSPPKGA